MSDPKRANDSGGVDGLGYHGTHIVGDGRVAHALEVLDAIAREEDGQRLDLRQRLFDCRTSAAG